MSDSKEEDVPIVPFGRKRGSIASKLAGLTQAFYLKAFAFFDKDKNGFVSKDEILAVLAVLGRDPEESLEQLNRIDENGDNQISETEFLQFFQALGALCDSSAEWKLLEKTYCAKLGMIEHHSLSQVEEDAKHDTFQIVHGKDTADHVPP